MIESCISLNTLVAPALACGPLSERPVTLVVLEISSETGWLSNELRAEHAHGVRHLIKRCLHSEMDVLLPKMGSSGAVELFFIVAATDARGADAIAKRIQKQLAGSEYIQKAHLGVATYYRPVGPLEERANETPIEISSRITSELQSMMDRENSARMGAN